MVPQKKCWTYILGSVLVFIVITMCVGMGSNWYAAQRANYYQNKTMVDLVHTHVPPIPHWVPEMMVWMGTLAFFITSFVSSSDNYFHQWIQFVVLFCILTLLKSVIVHATVFPTLHTTCNRPLFSPQGNCNDYMFSGHMMMVTLAFMFMLKNQTVSSCFMIFYLFITALAISASRNHYTVDVVVGFILGVLVFNQLNPKLASLLE